ncbi:hypothetical protein NDU88_004171 [Pleurodeles waltl]|uniref:Uncharacterized protein n=1 Tax=Pleurodeles waltl TaxID=8319 RepID=A0AAV7UGD8_PLEWA|nr:hypothetical protein NDU88_004171 [Pleurodeles waltl]
MARCVHNCAPTTACCFKSPPSSHQQPPTPPSGRRREKKKFNKSKTRRALFGGRNRLTTAAPTISTAPATRQTSAPGADGELFHQTRPPPERASISGEKGPLKNSCCHTHLRKHTNPEKGVFLFTSSRPAISTQNQQRGTSAAAF